MTAAINMSGGDTVDYSDFDYQHVDFQHRELGGNSPAATISQSVDPLATRGGLDVNEVAELVAMRYDATVQTDDYEGTGDTAEGSVEFRGVFGINLDSDTDLLANSPVISDGSAVILDEDTDSSIDADVRGHDKDEVLHHWMTATNAPFSNFATGLGGSGGYIYDKGTVNFRELTGRGPVIDSGDSMSTVVRLVKNQVSAEVEAAYRVTLIWDVSTVDDAGRRFSVPSDD